MPVSPINSNEQYYLVEVIAFVLKYLKDQLYGALKLSGRNMSQIQFDWVVTVPAIWDVRGKQMMREAAYKVNAFCSIYQWMNNTTIISARNFSTVFDLIWLLGN